MDLFFLLFGFLVFSGFIKGFSGFGMSLFLAGFLVSFFDPIFIIPVLALLSLSLNIFLLVEHWHPLHKVKSSFLLKPETLISLVVGIVCGVLLLSYVSALIVKFILGIFIIFFVVLLFAKHKKKFSLLSSFPVHILVGLSTGFFSGLVNVNGPPAALVNAYAGLKKTSFIASMLVFMVIADVLTIGFFLIKGLFSLDSLVTYLQIIPFVVLGLIFGRLLRSKLSEKKFKLFILILLLFVGVKLIVECLFF